MSHYTHVNDVHAEDRALLGCIRLAADASRPQSAKFVYVPQEDTDDPNWQPLDRTKSQMSLD